MTHFANQFGKKKRPSWDYALMFKNKNRGIFPLIDIYPLHSVFSADLIRNSLNMHLLEEVV
jgi:hypothetical protein